MKYIDFKNQKIAFSASDSKGTAVVFLHGFCEDSTMWEDFTEDLEEDYQVIKIDLPGHGASEINSPFSVKEMSEVITTVLQHLGVKKFILIGHSMGGYVSLEAAKEHKDNLLGLGLFHSHPFADSKEKKANRYKSIEFIESHGHELFAKKLIPTLFKSSFAGSGTHLISKMVFRASRYPVEGFKNALRAMAEREDNSDILKTLTCPVLMIIGKFDKTLNFEKMMEQTAMPQLADVHVLERAGHMGMFSEAKGTRKIVKKFIGLCEQNS